MKHSAEMNDFLTVETVTRVTDGRLVDGSADAGPASGASIDTRELAAGQLFVALAGERTDGHEHLQAASDAGASIALVERDVEPPLIPSDPPDSSGASRDISMAIVRVESCRRALAALASAYRDTLRSTRVIAVTGSNGKTTTVRLIDAVLSTAMGGSASRKSFNNELGLPLTILNAAPTDGYLVCEVGMSTPGEIRGLASVVRPDIGVITSIGRAHLEAFGTTEAIAVEKASLLQELAGGGLGIVNADHEELTPALPADIDLVRFGKDSSADVRVTSVIPTAAGIRFMIGDASAFEVPLHGVHNATNAAAAIAVARRMGLDDATIAGGLRGASPPPMRFEARQIGSVEIINDAYNANPDSMLASLAAFALRSAPAGRRVVVLGDMLELGAAAEHEHRLIGEAIARSVESGTGPDAAVLVGPMMAFAAHAVRGALGSDAVTTAGETGDGSGIASLLAPGDAVLLKGSRGIGLERVAAALGRTEAAPSAR
ncbi:MAG: UDP-N-acetylmuramoyl-tripeptide--D-alanyl-D-alanine ligase [Planctomycetota bacterium]